VRKDETRNQRRARVAICLPSFGGGGAERVTLSCIEALIAKRCDVDFLLVKKQGELLPLLPPAVRVIELGGGSIRGAIGPLVRYLKSESPDTLHLVMWPLTVVGILAHRLARSRARLGVSDHIAFTPELIPWRHRAAIGLTVRLLYPLADFRTIISGRGADALSSLSGLPRDRFEVLGNPISPPARIASTPQVEALWQGRPRLLSIGSLKPQKNQALLLRAFARLENREASLVILGEGELRGELEALSRDLGIADRVAMPGFAIDPWPYLAAADAFVLSSDWEGLPLVLAESLHAGLPIISTDCPSGPAELLGGGEFGRLVPCGDAEALARAIDEVLADPPDPARQRARAAEVTGPRTIERYLELLLG
jgi:glycosyltransferase involved in cell wall biosynthesis